MKDLSTLRSDFPMLKNNPELIYFDNGATTLKPQVVIDAVTDFYTTHTSNVHRGDYAIAALNDRLYDEARSSFAKLLNCEAREVVFTHNASASLNQVIYGLSHGFLHEGDIILTTEAEHASNLLPWFRLVKEAGVEVKYLPMNAQANVDLEAAKELFTPRVKVVAVAMVTNVLGSILPIKELSALAHEVGALTVIDGSQAVPHMKVDVKELGIDFLACSAHKMCGPGGVGILYGRYDLLEAMEPVFMGGDMNARFDAGCGYELKHAPTRFEAGTPNIEGVIGAGAACEYLLQIGLDEIHAYEKELRSYFMEQMKQLSNIQVYNPDNEYGPITFNAEGVFSQDAAGYLSARNIAVRSGNHCAKILHEIIGTDSTIRASLYFYNTKEEVDACVAACADITLENAIGIFF
ncbi:MAG: cysteine desulfurase [Solobacterium sp.]|nr:cysteine desulfurase [Solobacterium sp.]